MTKSFECVWPDRPESAPTASEWLEDIKGVDRHQRELEVLKQVTSGNVPTFMRRFHEVPVAGGGYTGTVYVLPHYLCVGSDDDFVFTPLNPLTAQHICEFMDGTLPTEKMVDDVWAAGDTVLSPRAMQPPQFPYDGSMMATSRWPIHTKWIRQQIEKKGAKLDTLTVGYKKDVTLDLDVEQHNFIKVGVYGFHQLNGKAIHKFKKHSHEVTYCDYSHGIRLFSNNIDVDDVGRMQVTTALKDKDLCCILTDEGPYKIAKYPTDRAIA